MAQAKILKEFLANTTKERSELVQINKFLLKMYGEQHHEIQELIKSVKNERVETTQMLKNVIRSIDLLTKQMKDRKSYDNIEGHTYCIDFKQT